MNAIKNFFQTILWVFIAVAAAGVLLLTFLTVTEYQPEATENVEITGTAAGESVPLGRPLSILSWNVGFPTSLWTAAERLRKPAKRP